MALKFASKQAIEQEVRCRLKLDKTKVLPLLRFHVPQDQRDSYISEADNTWVECTQGHQMALLHELPSAYGGGVMCDGGGRGGCRETVNVAEGYYHCDKCRRQSDYCLTCAGKVVKSGCWYGVEVAVEHSNSASKVSKDGTVLNCVLVMPWADSTLSDEIRNKQIAGTSFDIVKAIMKNVAEALQHMHTQK